MRSFTGAPLLIGILVGLLIGLLAWEFQRVERAKGSNASLEAGDDILLGLIVLSAFALGVFLAFVFLGVG